MRPWLPPPPRRNTRQLPPRSSPAKSPLQQEVQGRQWQRPQPMERASPAQEGRSRLPRSGPLQGSLCTRSSCD